MDDDSRRCTKCLAGAGCRTVNPSQTTLVVMPPGQPRFPSVRPYRRGSAAEAARLANSPQELGAAQAEFEAAKYAPSSAAAQLSRARLWCRTARSLGFEPYERTPEVITKTVGLLWASGYRTAMATATRAKRDFENKFNGNWTPELRKALKDAEPACTRGLGPPRQSIPYPEARLSELPPLAAPRVPGGALPPPTGGRMLLRASFPRHRGGSGTSRRRTLLEY